MDRLYTQSIQPVMAKLTDAEREALTLQAAGLLKENWTAAVKAIRAPGPMKCFPA